MRNLLAHGPFGSYELEVHVQEGRMVFPESLDSPAEFTEDRVEAVMLCAHEEINVTAWALRYIGSDSLLYGSTEMRFVDLPSPIRKTKKKKS